VRSLLREQPLLTTVLATAIAAVAVIVIARVTGADSVGRAFRDVQPGWLALVAVCELATYPFYVLAYRTVAGIHGHAPLPLGILTRVVVAVFGPFALAGGFGLDRRMLAAVHEDERSASVRVLALGTLEWAVLAPTACISAIALLAQGANIMPSLLWPWALAVPPAFAFALWASHPSRSAWLSRVGGHRVDLVVQMLEGIHAVLDAVVREPSRFLSALAGITAYWAADICALWASLRVFGIDLGLGRPIIAYSTGYVATRRSLPLGGAGPTEFLMTYALYWVREPLAPALAAVIVYRAFNFLAIAIPAMIANRQLGPLVEAFSSPSPSRPRSRSRSRSR
jgi:uncharacterized membrane protein YbhN (UPF0104 family)